MPDTHRKLFVLDTNVILHDSACIHNFQDNDVVIPIPVLEELDHFKKGNDTLNFHAREFVRTLDTLSEDKLFGDGMPLGEGKGSVIVKLETKFNEKLVANFSKSNPDHHILNTAYQLAQDFPKRQVILVSKDVNLRMKAKAVGLMSEDYTSDHVKKDLASFYTGCHFVDELSDDFVDRFEDEDENQIPKDEFPVETEYPLLPNEYIVLNEGPEEYLVKVNNEGDKIQKVNYQNAYGIMSRNREQQLALDALLNPDITLVSLAGKAGTGKTLLALAAALEQMKIYNQICVARPIVALSNKDLGFLPGDINQKIEPYMQPLYDNLGVIQNQFLETDSRNMTIKRMLEEEKLVISPLAYIRGRSLVKSFFIVDEAQNLTPHEIKTIITRAGDGTKMVFTGDIFQIDHAYLDSSSNGLSYLIDRMQEQGVYAHVTLSKGERSPLAEIASNLL